MFLNIHCPLVVTERCNLQNLSTHVWQHEKKPLVNTVHYQLIMINYKQSYFTLY